jgi:hypothetical protein
MMKMMEIMEVMEVMVRNQCLNTPSSTDSAGTSLKC